MKKLLALCLAATILMGSLIGCGTKEDSSASSTAVQSSAAQTTSQATEVKPVKLTFLVGDVANQEWFESKFPELISGDNEQKITVEVEYQKEATKILQMKAATNEIPDLLNLGLPQEMLDQGKFLDLSNEAWWSDLYPSAKELSTDVKSGKNYVVPLASSAVGIFYNKDIFNELGLKQAVTWEDFVKNLEAVKKAKPDIIPFYMGGKDAWSLSHIMEYTLMGVGKQTLGYTGYEKALAANDLATLKWDESENGVLGTFEKCMLELKAKGLINDNVVTATADNQADVFANGKAAFISQGMWVLSDLKAKNPNFTSVGFAPYPTILEGTKNVVGAPLEGTIAISASSKNIDAAKKVVEMMLSDDSIKSFCETRSAIPIKKSVDANWSFMKDDVSAVLNSDVYAATWTQNLPGAFNSDENGRLVQNIFVNKYATPVEFAKDYLKMWNSAYEAANK